MNRKEYLNRLIDRVIHDFFTCKDEFPSSIDDYKVRIMSKGEGISFQLIKGAKIEKTKTLNSHKFKHLYEVVYREYNIQ